MWLFSIPFVAGIVSARDITISRRQKDGQLFSDVCTLFRFDSASLGRTVNSAHRYGLLISKKYTPLFSTAKTKST